MNWAVLTFPAIGALVGGFIGMWHGDKEGGDLNFAPLLEGMLGMLIGGAAGIVVAAVVA